MLAVQKPSVGLEDVRRVSDVRGKDRVVPTDAVDLECELDGNTYFSREAHDRGPAKALPIDDEPGRPRLLDERDGHRAAAILERFGGESPAAEIEGELPDSLGLVVPGVAAAEEAHDQTRVRRKRLRRLDVLDADSGASDEENYRQNRHLFRHR